MIHEYSCRKCGETFIGDGKEYEIHNDCGGIGILERSSF